MKSLGIVRNIDDLGRVVIPSEIRKIKDMKAGTPVEFFADGTYVLMKKYSQVCVLCNSKENIDELFGKPVCKECISKLKEKLLDK